MIPLEEADGLDELYVRIHQRALLLARRVLGDSVLAQDAVQDAFAQLWEQADRISADGGKLESLAMTVVHRRAIDMARRRKRQETVMPNLELFQRSDETASSALERAEELAGAMALHVRLNEALSALPPEQALIVRHTYFRNLSLSQIAAREGLPLGTVKSRLRLAMAKLSNSIRAAST